MSVLILMIPMALLMGLGFLAAFLYGVNDGQFDDVETPAHRILKNETPSSGKD
ncbi:MAG: cbb3-type cytochrome oxidase assembly protein CcoS [Bdellovibrionaceae bacterium]|nr:cbb3-type cytochrome oxidase assembly protein CcoS [Pseudobdellovibrionaceae bacterium]